MRPRAIAFITLLALAAAPGAAAGPSPTVGGGADPWSCGPWIAAAEQQYAIPTGLLQAVGLTETGTIAEQLRPWALNVDGEPVAAASLSLAARTVVQRARAVSVDIGCLQINLRAHVATVPDLSWLFFPKFNAAYGGWFLADSLSSTRILGPSGRRLPRMAHPIAPAGPTTAAALPPRSPASARRVPRLPG